MTETTTISPASFVYESLPTRVIFGHGTRTKVKEEADRLGILRPLIVHSPGHAAIAEAIAEDIGRQSVTTFGGAKMHTPVEVTEAALVLAAGKCADGIIAVGGGSTTGLSKAIALRTDLPQIVLPTTYAGSEMTPILGETRDGAKTTLRSLKVLPETVIYDVDLTLDLPRALTGVSGMNAMAHAVEALYARDANPIISALAIESIRALAQSLPAIHADPRDRAARKNALYGAWLAGVCLGSVGMALHHKLCHTLGGTFNLPHAESHAIVLPHALAYNAPAIPQVMARLSEALNHPDPALALHEMSIAAGTPTALSEIGMPEDGVDKAIELALANPYWNPRPLERDALRDLIGRAFRGMPPSTSAMTNMVPLTKDER
ncbi:MAG: maleylacetate reductase [Ralstonia sp.]|jgi:maleylacetate reductase|uniref:Maleylacetate reductase n=2 Tax=Burkholderiaceae TaxID=119060 RepID=A0ABM9IW32_RALPI|nr:MULTISPECIES: maleylacetate reductase [Ralstonia]MCL6486221.1 maleylacetate reductase [Janthinobacterium lividum]NPA77100.1 maleylacetate reductase [Candidatus Diapherotrites archaeon]MBA4233366.1 maleylacetate reductase [Ralstonia sp.]POH85973.1 maleylacetate reductase [Ralstonia pickettii]CAJ0733699.1 Maleylacetate reductase [Ralstonia pickettii]